MNGEALDLALAVYREPFRRFALRSRPLPADIDAVIQLAAGTQPHLGEAAASRGETDETIIEASRFYLQQVLFQPDADAYRMLGVTPAADAETMRRHYLGLQRWLHPDRRGGDWEAALATRVNWAWQQLRTETARLAYASEVHEVPAEESTDPEAESSLPVRQWVPVSLAPERTLWWKRIALGTSISVCVALTLAAVMLREPPSTDESPSDAPRTVAPKAQAVLPPLAPAPSVDDGLDRQVVASRGAEPPAAQTSAVATSTQAAVTQQIVHAETASAAADASSVVATDMRSRDNASPSRAGIARESQQPPPQMAVAAQNASTATPAFSTAPQSREHAQAATAATAKASEGPIMAAAGGVPEQSSSKAGSANVAVVYRGESDPQARIAPAAKEAVAVDRIAATTQRTVAARPPTGSVAVAADVRGPAPATFVPPASAKLQESQNVAAISSAETSPAIGNATRPNGEPGPALEAVRLQSDSAAAGANAVARLDMARQRFQDLTHYFARLQAPTPPLWNDVEGQLSAERQRAAMFDRARIQAAGDFDVETPIWKLSSSAAAVSGNYRLRTGRTVSETGHIAMDLVWRERMWLVTRVELNPSP